MHVVAGRDVVEINCYPLGGVAKGQIVSEAFEKINSEKTINTINVVSSTPHPLPPSAQP